VGRELEPGLRVLTVAHRQVELGAGGGAPTVTLSLPPLAEAQRGRPGDMPGMPGAQPGMPPGAVFNGMPGAMRVPPMPPVRVPQGLPQNAGMVDGRPGNLPYQPDGIPEPTQPEPGPNRLR
jgi:hypothetical protein